MRWIRDIFARVGLSEVWWLVTFCIACSHVCRDKLPNWRGTLDMELHSIFNV